MLATMRRALLIVFCSHGFICLGFQGIKNNCLPSRRSLISIKSTLLDLQNNLFDMVNTKLGLKLTDFTRGHDGIDWKSGDWSGSAEWWDEQKGSKLTGVTKSNIRGPNGFLSSTLNVWMGPGLMVPHMLLTTTINPSSHSGVSVTADYIPRGPTPLGSDQTYLESYFFGKDVQLWYEKASKAGGHLPPADSMSARLLRSPMYVSVGGLTEDIASALSTEHVERWLQWIAEARPVEARQKGAINGRDDKLREFYFRHMLADSTALVGPAFARSLAAARTGPVAEAYVGGGG